MTMKHDVLSKAIYKVAYKYHIDDKAIYTVAYVIWQRDMSSPKPCTKHGNLLMTLKHDVRSKAIYKAW